MFFLGLRPGPLSTELCFYGPAARLFLPSGQGFRLFGESLFFCARKKKVTKKKRRPAGPSASLPTPSGASLNSLASGGGRGSSVLKREAHQPCRLKPPRKICLTCNPPRAIRNSLEKHPSLATLLGLSSSAPISEGRGALYKTWSVSAATFEANRLLSAGGYIMPLKCQLCLAFCQPVN